MMTYTIRVGDTLGTYRVIRSVSRGLDPIRYFGQVDTVGQPAHTVMIIRSSNESGTAKLYEGKSLSQIFSQLTHPSLPHHRETIRRCGQTFEVFDTPALLSSDERNTRLSPGTLTEQLLEVVPALMELHAAGLTHGNIGSSTFRRAANGRHIVTGIENAGFGKDPLQDIRALGIYCERALGAEPEISVDVFLRKGNKSENSRLRRVIHGIRGTKSYPAVESMLQVYDILSGYEDTIDVGSRVRIKKDTVRVGIVSICTVATLASTMAFYPPTDGSNQQHTDFVKPDIVVAEVIVPNQKQVRAAADDRFTEPMEDAPSNLQPRKRVAALYVTQNEPASNTAARRPISVSLDLPRQNTSITDHQILRPQLPSNFVLQANRSLQHIEPTPPGAEKPTDSVVQDIKSLIDLDQLQTSASALPTAFSNRATKTLIRLNNYVATTARRIETGFADVSLVATAEPVPDIIELAAAEIVEPVEVSVAASVRGVSKTGAQPIIVSGRAELHENAIQNTVGPAIISVKRAKSVAQSSKESTQPTTPASTLDTVTILRPLRDQTAKRSAKAPKSVTTPILTAAPALPVTQSSPEMVDLAQIATKAIEPGIAFRDCETCPEMVALPPVAADVRFAIATTEVTVSQYAVFIQTKEQANGLSTITDNLHTRGPFNPGFEQDGRHPVTYVSVEDASAYATWLSKKTGAVYRLPTLEEWELAAGSTNQGGANERNQCNHVNGADAALRTVMPNRPAAGCNDGFVATAPVKQFSANTVGVYDMVGNVGEWVLSPTETRAHISKGGSWMTSGDELSVESSHEEYKGTRAGEIGFRLVRELP